MSAVRRTPLSGAPLVTAAAALWGTIGPAQVLAASAVGPAALAGWRQLVGCLALGVATSGDLGAWQKMQCEYMPATRRGGKGCDERLRAHAADQAMSAARRAAANARASVDVTPNRRAVSSIGITES